MSLYLQTLSSMQIKDKQPAYITNWGAAYVGDSIDLLRLLPDSSVNLFLTSPPFALQRKKEYGNEDQTSYVEWLAKFGELMRDKLVENGSLIIDIGGAYKQGTPSRSLYNFRVLLKFCDDLGFHLAEDFYWFNPAKLPSPIEWVNKRKIRAKDSVNTVWWLSKSSWPKANISNVLTEYSERMKKLLTAPESYYRPKKRPSGHEIGKGFSKDNGGAIPSNLLSIPNTESNSVYLKGCSLVNAKHHPARFPAKLPEFFIKMLTESNDVVVDIFSGSNTTGFVSERLQRKWLAFEQRRDYVASSVFRFCHEDSSEMDLRRVHEEIINDQTVDLRTLLLQETMNETEQTSVSQLPLQPIQGRLILDKERNGANDPITDHADYHSPTRKKRSKRS